MKSAGPVGDAAGPQRASIVAAGPHHIGHLAHRMRAGDENQTPNTHDRAPNCRYIHAELQGVARSRYTKVVLLHIELKSVTGNFKMIFKDYDILISCNLIN